ncbi:hypothetical protein CRUP_019417 [Coryphaenoides rupestris]|nr:hypothetical protein CRUP_019417 [Coryphaenoides rupestris]
MNRANRFRAVKEQREMLSLVLPAIQPGHNMDGLEVIGSGGPFVHPNHLPEDEEELEQTVPEKPDPGGQDDDDDDDDVDETGSVTPVPALTFCGQSVQWTPSQGQPGISSRMSFDVVNVGETARSHLLLRNRGNAAIYYTWQRLELPRCFAGPPGTAAAAWQTQTATHFYFNSSMGVILPSETQQVEVLFKSDTPGIKCELWQLNTHPVLLGGATVQVTMRGVALDRDTNAHHRLILERELEKKATVKVCQSLVYEVLRGVASPERPSSPAELYITEDQDTLQGQWRRSRDFGRVVLSLPEEDPGPRGTHCTLTRDQGLARLNSTLLELPQHPFTSVPITATTVGRQLWRELLDGLAGEASRLRHLLGLPETDTWSQPTRDPVTPDIDRSSLIVVFEDEGTKEKGEWKGGAKAKEDGRGASKSPAKVVVLMEELVSSLLDALGEEE